MKGTPKTIVVEAGPLTMYGADRRDIAGLERTIKNEVDRLVRAYFRVGPYSQTVKTRLEER